MGLEIYKCNVIKSMVLFIVGLNSSKNNRTGTKIKLYDY